MSLAIGMRLGPYEIVSLLGAGGMGEVYRARDPRLGRDVAIKILPEHLATDRDALARFEREAKAIAALSHPNILAIFDVGADQGSATSSPSCSKARRCGPAPSARRGLARRRRNRRRHRGGAGERALEGHHPSRPQARQHLPDRRGRREDSRLRAGALTAQRGPPMTETTHTSLNRARHVSAPSAICRRSRCAAQSWTRQRPVLVRLRAVRDGGRPARLRSGHGAADHDRDSRALSAAACDR